MHMKFRIVIALLMVTLMLAGCGGSSNEKFVEGKHYSISTLHDASNTPQVIKFVSFACPACRGIEKVLADYNPPESVIYERFQVRFNNPSYDALMRAYATLRSLNIHDKLAPDLFEAIQDNRQYLADKHSLAIWVNKLLPEVKMDIVKKAYVHDKSTELVNMYYAAEMKYNITSIPTIWVNGNVRIILQNLEGETPEEVSQFLIDLLNHLTLEEQLQTPS